MSNFLVTDPRREPNSHLKEQTPFTLLDAKEDQEKVELEAKELFRQRVALIFAYRAARELELAQSGNETISAAFKEANQKMYERHVSPIPSGTFIAHQMSGEQNAQYLNSTLFPLTSREAALEGLNGTTSELLTFTGYTIDKLTLVRETLKANEGSGLNHDPQIEKVNNQLEEALDNLLRTRNSLTEFLNRGPLSTGPENKVANTSNSSVANTYQEESLEEELRQERKAA